jgi:hypothetical protein
MLDYLINSVDHIGHGACLVIVLVVALKCQALLGLVMPGESLVLVGDFCVGQAGCPHLCDLQRRNPR